MIIDFDGILDTINPIYRPLYKCKNRYMVLYGGAGSGKSVFASQKLLLRIMLEKNHRFLIVKKVARTIRNTSFKQITDTLSSWNIKHLAKINKTDLSIEFPDFESEILCIGMDDPEKVKSITGITGIWIEEPTDANESDINQLNLRLRGNTGKYKQIMLSFNPISSNHWLKKRFFDSDIDDKQCIKTTYKDNIYIDEDYKRELENYKHIDRYYYDVYCLGKWGVIGGLIYNNWAVEDISDREFSEYAIGLDFGFTTSKTAIIKMAYKDDTIYIVEEAYEKGLMNDQIAEICKSKFSGSYIYCDSAEPKSIMELKVHGVKALSVKKGKDSVKHGIQWIRQKRVVISPKCRNFINEIQSYKYKEDKDGNQLEVPVPINDHLMDAMRYGLNNLMRAYKQMNISAGDLGL